MKLVARAACLGVKAYQYLRAGRPSPCRFIPSCSQYALEALEYHGIAKGGWLSVRRLCQCHPWGGMGLDPVPVTSTDSDICSDADGQVLDIGRDV